MSMLLKRIKQKIWYALYYKKIFNRTGNKVSLFEPLRVDGAQFIVLGDRVSIQSNTWLYADNPLGAGTVLEIGDGSVLGYNNHITAIQNVKIGNNVLTANNVYISDNLHSFESIEMPIMHQKVFFKGETTIGDGSWLGENVCIVGVKVGKNCVIGANSVVTKDVPDYSVAVGSPAKVIRQFCPNEKIWKSIKD
jgi:acetyltransferase-like isoleucine patch superfamily enzyme